MGDPSDEAVRDRPVGAMSYRLQRPLLWIGGWLVWGAGLSAVWLRGWSLATARPWFPALLALTVTAAGVACRYWWPRWHTVEATVGGEQPGLELRSLARRERVPLPPPVECRLYEQTVAGRALVDLGSRLTAVRTYGKRTELFVTSGGLSIVLSARGLRKHALRDFAAEAAQALSGKEPAVERHTIARISGGHRRRDPATRWLNPDAGSGSWAQMLSVVVFGVAAAFLTAGALPALAYGGPTSPPVVSTAEVERRLVNTLDTLTADLAAVDLPGAEGLSVDIDLEQDRCRRDGEWFWGPGDDARLEATAVITLDRPAAPVLRERLGAVAKDLGATVRETWSYRPEGDLWESVALDIELTEIDAGVEHAGSEATEPLKIAVSFDTPCLRPDDRAALQPIARDHARQLVEALVGSP